MPRFPSDLVGGGEVNSGLVVFENSSWEGLWEPDVRGKLTEENDILGASA